MYLRQKLIIMVASVLSGLACQFANADFRSYEAEIEESVWAYQGNRVRCELSHAIPRYGEAHFFAKASRSPNMAFILDGQRNRVKTGKAVDVRIMAPLWHPGRGAKDLERVSVVPGEKILNVMDDAAWRLLSALENGNTPAFFYRDFDDDSDRVSIALSSVNFQKVYHQFLTCVEGLLPYDFREIQYTLVHFNFNGTQLTDDDKRKLDVLAEFIKFDPDIEAVLLEGHTDSIALRRYNRNLGYKRASNVKQYLVDKGVTTDKIRVHSHGEMKPLESNHTEQGRAMNRRVFITMSKG